MKKSICLAMLICLLISVMTSCGNNADAITVITREEGSGTRGAFTELFDIGENLIDTAETTSSTSVMMTTVAGNESAIGYISLGSLNNTIKALKIDGAQASVKNIKNGSYKVSRPFNIVVKSNLSAQAQDFISFIMSDEGQAVVEENGYVSNGSTGKYTATKVSGKVAVGGSSSVTPVMEKLKEAYIALNSSVEVTVQQNDSTTGVTSAVEGVYDIGMASRELKNSETSKGVSSKVIALDGIAVIVNNNSTVEDITSDDVKSIYTGEKTLWSELG